MDREKYRRLERVGPFDRAWLSLINADKPEEKVSVLPYSPLFFNQVSLVSAPPPPPPLSLLPTHTQKKPQLAVELIVHERPARSFEPGLSKSLHTRDWMGDVYFEDRNFLGLNQVKKEEVCPPIHSFLRTRSPPPPPPLILTLSSSFDFFSPLSTQTHIQAMVLKLCKGLIQQRKEPCITMSAEFHDNPLKPGVHRSFSLYRDPAGESAVREGGSARFHLPWLGRSSLFLPPIHLPIQPLIHLSTKQTKKHPSTYPPNKPKNRPDPQRVRIQC